MISQGFSFCVSSPASASFSYTINSLYSRARRVFVASSDAAVYERWAHDKLKNDDDDVRESSRVEKNEIFPPFHPTRYDESTDRDHIWICIRWKKSSRIIVICFRSLFIARSQRERFIRLHFTLCLPSSEKKVFLFSTYSNPGCFSSHVWCLAWLARF